MSRVFDFALLCLILGFSVYFVKSEEYDLSHKRDTSDDEDGLMLDINPDDNKRGDYYDRSDDEDVHS